MAYKKMSGGKGKRQFPATDPGCDPVQRGYGDGGPSPAMGGGKGQGAGLKCPTGVPKSGKP